MGRRRQCTCLYREEEKKLAMGIEDADKPRCRLAIPIDREISQSLGISVYFFAFVLMFMNANAGQSFFLVRSRL